VRLGFAEHDFSSGAEYYSDVTERTSFDVSRVTHRHGCEIYVCGRANGIEDVVERWDIVPDAGGYASSRPTSNTPIGNPAPLGTTSTFLQGNAFIEPSARAAPILNRQEIYRGAAIGGFQSAVIDPEGRFMLVLSEQAKIIRVPLQSVPSSPTELYTSTQLPYLAQATSINVFDHATEGRKYVLMNRGATEDGIRLVLHDYDNDGEVDVTEMLDDAAWAVRAYDQNWVNDFVSYPW
jgi:hypothetical protein